MGIAKSKFKLILAKKIKIGSEDFSSILTWKQKENVEYEI